MTKSWQTEFDEKFEVKKVDNGLHLITFKQKPIYLEIDPYKVMDEIKAFIQDLLDRKAERIGWLKKPIKHSNCVRDYDHCECHDWEKENNILNQALSILKEE